MDTNQFVFGPERSVKQKNIARLELLFPVGQNTCGAREKANPISVVLQKKADHGLRGRELRNPFGTEEARISPLRRDWEAIDTCGAESQGTARNHVDPSNVMWNAAQH